jgi:hypothetical protein
MLIALPPMTAGVAYIATRGAARAKLKEIS